MNRGVATQLTQNMRQRHEWERGALEHLREGPPEPALKAYERHGRIVVEAGSDATRDRLADDWWAAGDPRGAVMLAHRRADVADLNARARARMHAAGALGDELDTPAGSFAVGDVVVVKRNDPRRGINNGDRAQVVDADRRGLVIESRGERVRLDARWLAEPTVNGGPPLEHGYAITGHIAQGLTVDKSFVLVSEGVDREWIYVAMSRGRDENRLYLTASPDDDRAEFAPGPRETRDAIDRLRTQLQTSGGQVLAIDSGTPVDDQPARSEPRRFGWLPGRRREPETPEQREADAARQWSEKAHGALPLDSEQRFHESADALARRHADRMTERALGQKRGLGREL